MHKKRIPDIDTNHINEPRIFFIEYFLYSNYVTFEKNDPGTGSFKTKFALFMLLTSIIIVVLSLFSEYVYDINQIIRDNWPFKSDVYKSPLNPKVAPAVVANAIAIVFMWGRWTNKNLQLIIQRFQQEKYKSQGWIFFVAMLFFQPLQF